MDNSLLYFSATWCNPCKMFAPIMDEISETITVTKYDVDIDKLETSNFVIKNVPTVILVDSEGHELRRFAGVKSKQQVLEFYKG